jgi:acetolactate synthase-1/2/3 large subunit
LLLIFTGIANAKVDSIPMLIITGQVGRAFLGTDAFQEIDIIGITKPIVKHSYIVKKTELLPKIINEAIFLAQNGRPGPVLIDIPKDVGLELVQKYEYSKVFQLYKEPSYKTQHTSSLINFQKIINLCNQAYKPLLYVGGGILRSNSIKALQQFAKIFQIPVTTTLMGKSCYNEKDTLSLGM